MSIKLYNTFTGAKEEFKPLNAGQVKLYVCGVTVYDHCHIGHARSAIVFDVIHRHLKTRGFDVVFAKNFTDIDDKILRKANTEGIPWKEVGEKYIGSYKEDMKDLNILPPTFEPKATDHIDDMIRLVESLLEKGHAYRVDDDVYFSVNSFPGYGRLSNRSLDEMMAGARVDVDERKKNPLDFALWKGSKEGEPFWDAPFGKGRPGWHIECSVMSAKYLGVPFDIHGGGKDLVFPHHENERAQSEAADGRRFVNYWIHNGFVNIEKEKMSKSLGNFLLIKDFLKDYHPEVLRLFFLATQYRNPVDYTDKSIEDTNSALQRLYYTLTRTYEMEKDRGIAAKQFPEVADLEKKYYDAMDDDFNTALALTSVFELSKMINRMLDEHDESGYPSALYARDTLLSLAQGIGLLHDDLTAFSEKEKTRHLVLVDLNVPAIERMIEERVQARKNKDYTRSDEIRDLLARKGVLLNDTPAGTDWRIKSVVMAKGENR
ncbi:MAG: cysteine--tRNA ligase [Syntrophobacterales bacterium]|jgi:cysteinyl-tRNA synthetase|nr:cysteine--tRNA ligase [Syntrophobacterales bacterium]